MQYSAEFTEDAIRHYVNEFEFAALRRKDAIASSNYTEKDLLDFDRRLFGLCQGVANHHKPCLKYAQSRWERFEDEDLLPVLFFIYSINGDIEGLTNLAKQLDDAKINYIEAINIVLTWVSEKTLQQLMTRQQWPANTDNILATIAIKSYRAGLVNTQYLLDVYPNLTHPIAKVTMINGFGDNKVTESKPLLYAEYESDDPKIKLPCYRALLLLDEANVLSHWQTFIDYYQDDEANPLLELLVKRLDYDDVLTLINPLFSSPPQYDKALTIVGMSGLTACIPWIINLIEHGIEIDLATEQLELIAGLDVVKDDMEKETDKGFTPDLEKIQRWWKQNEQHLLKNPRCLSGQSLNYANLVSLFQSSNQLCRYSASLYLALLSPQTPLLDLNEPSFSLYYANILENYQGLLTKEPKEIQGVQKESSL